MTYQKNFGKDLCAFARARSKNVCVRINVHLKMCAHTFLPPVHMFLHVLVVYYYVMTLSLKFHKDLSFR